MEPRVDSPISWVDWALQDVDDTNSGTPDTDGVDITLTQADGEHLNYRATGTTPWTELPNMADVQTLQTAVQAMTGDHTTLTTLTTLQTQTAALTGSQAALTTRVTTLETRSTAITGDVAGIASRTTALETRVVAITGVDATQDSRLVTLEARSTAVTGANAVQDTRLTVLEVRSVAATGANATQDVRLTWLETQLAAITGLAARVTAEEARTFRAASIPVPILLLGASSDQVVVWRNGAGVATPMPNTNYRVEFEPNPVLALGTQVTFAVVGGTQTVNGCTIRITAGLAIAVASWCNVNAFSNGPA